MFKTISKSLENTMNSSYFASILRHLLLIRNKLNGDKYWNIIDLIVQQIVVQFDGENTDVEKELLKLDMREIVKL